MPRATVPRAAGAMCAGCRPGPGRGCRGDRDRPAGRGSGTRRQRRRRAGVAAGSVCAAGVWMIALPPGTTVFLACQPIDLRAGWQPGCSSPGAADYRRRSVQPIRSADPFSGRVFIFRSKRGHYLKGLDWDGYWDGSGWCLFATRLERGKFVWLPLVDGTMALTMALTPAQLALLAEAMDWRRTIAPPAPLPDRQTAADAVWPLLGAADPADRAARTAARGAAGGRSRSDRKDDRRRPAAADP